MCLYIRYNRLTQNSNPTTQVKPAGGGDLMLGGYAKDI
jgi:hypothetical protein